MARTYTKTGLRSGWVRESKRRREAGADALTVGGFNFAYGSDKWEPAEWETILRAENVREDQVVGLLKSRQSKRGAAIRWWIEHNHHRRFVPEVVLRSIGLGGWEG